MNQTIIIGDIHGCADELSDLLERIGPSADDIVLSVGDLVDRGPKPADVVRFFRTQPNALALCGNHERKHVRGVFSYSQEICRLQMGASYEDDVRWMSALPHHYETDAVRVVHWGLYPGVPLDDVPEDVRAGTTSGDAKLRERYGEKPWFEHYTDDKPVVFGHHVVGDEPLVLRDRVFGIDTGCCHGGRLTALVLPSFRLVSVPARADHWARVRTEWQEPVLRSYAWSGMTFEQIGKKLRKLRHPEMPDAYLDRLEAWAADVRGALPALGARLDAEMDRLTAEVGASGFGRAAADHPAASWLQRRRAGRLGDGLGCGTPADVLALAAGLGVDLGIPRGPV